PAGRGNRTDPRGDVHRRRAGRLQPDRLHRLLVQRRRTDRRPGQPEPDRDPDRRLPLDRPLGGRRARPGDPLPDRRRDRGDRLGRRPRGRAGGRRRRRRGPCPGPADPARGPGRQPAVLGPVPPEGGAPAVVSTELVGVMDSPNDGAATPSAEAASGAAATSEPAIGRLLELTVTDLALIERLRLELAPGLNVFTGETGAGKSLLIDALGLAIGARADTTLVRHGAET